MSINSLLNTAREAMTAQQIAVHIDSQNVANATTAGYSKLRDELQAMHDELGQVRGRLALVRFEMVLAEVARVRERGHAGLLKR